ncbi:MAG TPA: Asp-tRNA(Asn)/Glu-tRNA(Gln) amidotransferase subunit GatC [Terriglobales bacterium]|nr:Asp-tRNA(Asn)/Glu-tRNA(Gln) amidotransferase subunit GatC [Terriglobales bacterium]
MKITQKDVQYVADLANLELTVAECERMQKDLNEILEYIDMLSELDTSTIAPMAQVQDVAAQTFPADALRSDELRECLPRELALKNATQTDGSFFRVPKVIER